MPTDDTLRQVAFVKRAKNRRKVLEALEQPAIPSELVLLVFKKSSESFFATVSRSLRELEEEKLIELLNPHEKTGRMYKLTSNGRAVLSYLHKEKARLKEVDATLR